jgi:hypothetical protein
VGARARATPAIATAVLGCIHTGCRVTPRPIEAPADMTDLVGDDVDMIG